MCFFHRWKYVREYFSHSFLGEEVRSWWNRFRICQKCGAAQEQEFAYWRPLSNKEKEVLLRKIVDKGDYFEVVT